jgi:hypothetical protein
VQALAQGKIKGNENLNARATVMLGAVGRLVPLARLHAVQQAKACKLH